MIRIGMSTSCVYPHDTTEAFRLAAAAGFDGIEVMVTHDPVTRDAAALAALSDRYGLPILSVHAPVLPLAQAAWSLSSAPKLARSAELAAALGASTVVAHPPFRWQGGYARGFESQVRELSQRHGIEIAVENMFPLVFGPLALPAYSHGPDPLALDCDAVTLDFSHASLAGRDSLEYAMAMGDRLRHVHLADGRGSMAQGHFHDDHLVPGRGTQPVAEVLQYLGSERWSGSIIAEVATRSAGSQRACLEMLRETVEFGRHHIALGLARRRSSSPA